MYTTTVTVPRITAEHIARLHSVVPRLTKFVKIPLMDTQEKASKFAVEHFNKNAERYEFAAKVNSITYDSVTDEWHVSIHVSGD